MRMIIKGADFSSVSIGKVVKDYSFHFAPDSVSAINGFFPNYNSGTPQATVWYSGSEGSTITQQSPIDERLVTDFIEVIPGMTIRLEDWKTGSPTTPAIVCFSAEKSIMSDVSTWWNSGGVKTVTVAENVKYIKIQHATNFIQGDAATADGTMPE